MKLFKILCFFVLLIFCCKQLWAQDGLHQLEKIFRDLKSSEWKIRKQAFDQLRNNPNYIEDQRTPGQLLDFLAFEESLMRRRAQQGLDAEDELYDEALPFAWSIWKDRLTSQAFQVFATSSYNPGSRFARELGSRAGRFVKELLALTTDRNEFIRENATALAGYALAEDQTGSAKLTGEDREALKRQLAVASADPNHGARHAVVNALALIPNRWSLGLLEQMQAREHTFHAPGENPLYLETDLKLISEAMRKVQSGLEKQSPPQ